MDVKALVVEQLEISCNLRTFRMESNHRKRLVVAFANEYDESREGPFHFLDDNYAHEFSQGFAEAKIRKVSHQNFFEENNYYFYNTSWSGIPTKRGSLTYYAFSLPEFAIPEAINIIDPYSGRQYRKNVFRDDQRNRFVIYLECRSSKGLFDFIMNIKFSLNKFKFLISTYSDDFCSMHGHQIDYYKLILDSKESNIVQQFFSGDVYMGDTYNAGQVGAMGPNSKANDISFQQIWLQQQGELNLEALAKELSSLRTTLRKRATAPEHDIAIGQVAAAEQAAKDGNGLKVLQHLKEAGKWTFECARDIGVDIASEIIKKSMGM